MSPAELTALAKAAPAQDGKVRLKPWIPACHELVIKGWSYRQIWQWLKDQGVRVQKDASTFAGAFSKNYKRWLAEQQGEGAK